MAARGLPVALLRALCVRPPSAVVRCSPDDQARIVEEKHLDGRAPDALVMQGHAVGADEGPEQREAQVGQGGERLCPVSPDCRLAAQDAGRLTGDVGDARRGHREVVVIVAENPFEIVAVPGRDPFLREMLGPGACQHRYAPWRPHPRVRTGTPARSPGTSQA